MVENIRAITTIEANSSKSESSVLFEVCKESIINKQNPSKLAEVLKIC